MTDGDVLFGFVFVFVGWWGQHLDEYPMGGYHCPVYCSVEHLHYQQPPDDIDNRPSFPLTYKNQPYADYTVSLSKSSYTDSCKP